jgi:hypothetical protein
MPVKTRTDPDRNFVLSQQSLSIPEADPFSQPDPLHGRNPPFRDAQSRGLPPLRTSAIRYHKKALCRPVCASSRRSFTLFFPLPRATDFNFHKEWCNFIFLPAHPAKRPSQRATIKPAYIGFTAPSAAPHSATLSQLHLHEALATRRRREVLSATQGPLC